MERSQIVKPVLIIAESRYAQTTKELNIVRLKNGFITYHFELRIEYILKENEFEKFQKDFIQQIHNGTVQKEKEIDLV